MKGQIDKLIKKYKKELEDYRKFVSEYEAKGTVNFGFQETENYGAYLGKTEVLEDIIKDLTILKM
jgi:hypothetical protein